MANRASINEVADLEKVEVPFLSEICCSEANFWTAIVKVDGRETHFKLDTGAVVSIVSNKEPWLKDFITPFGRFCFNSLPFGISSAPEIFQRTMSNILEDLDGVICRMDDILIHERNHVQHDACVQAVLLCLQRAGLTLNIQKCFARKTQVPRAHCRRPGRPC